MKVEEYRELISARRPKRDNPEYRLQCDVVAALQELEATGQLWVFDFTASLAGVNLSPAVRGRMKAAGVRKGWPDLQFACHDGLIRFVELKTSTGSLSHEQRLFRAWAEPKGCWALCRSVDAVLATLTAWGVVRERAA